MGLTPLQYSWLQFADPFAVYVKVDVDWRCGSGIGHYRQPNTMTYIGSTGVSVTLREANRMSVLLKLERGQEAQAELAIRCWHRNSCVQQFTLIKICFLRELPSCLDIGTCTDFPMATETQLSVCTSFLKRTNSALHPFLVLSLGSGGSCIRNSLTVSSHLSVQFRDVKRRRFCMISPVSYAIVRLSLCLEEPLKTRVRNLLKRIVQHRKITWPCHQACLYRFVAWFLFVFCGSIA